MKRLGRLVIASCALVGCLAAGPAFAAREGTFHRSLQVTGRVDIDVTTGSGNISVRSGGEGKVEITGHIRASGWFDNAQDRISRLEANPPIQQSGNSIRIGHIHDMDLFHNISISYDLVVPAQTQMTSHSGSGRQEVEGLAGSITVDSGSGDIRISNIANTVRAQTGSGDMKLESVKGEVYAKTGSGAIRAMDIGGGFEGETGSGHIEFQQSAPGAVHVKTGSGGIEARGVRGSLEARAGSGEIIADGEPRAGWIVHTGSGSVRLRLATDAAFDLNAHTSSGSISVNRPVTVQGIINRKEIRGRVRGGGPEVEVQTSSGNIEIL
ncbi:MAG TPA: DUF4097 family beta strand repeat-containing protein [Terriglobales bacterium]|nr:DUF4097 family beta strand repeat-containing protein [Terriglobales bacterium]